MDLSKSVMLGLVSDFADGHMVSPGEHGVVLTFCYYSLTNGMNHGFAAFNNQKNFKPFAKVSMCTNGIFFDGVGLDLNCDVDTKTKLNVDESLLMALVPTVIANCGLRHCQNVQGSSCIRVSGSVSFISDKLSISFMEPCSEFRKENYSASGDVPSPNYFFSVPNTGPGTNLINGSTRSNLEKFIRKAIKKQTQMYHTCGAGKLVVLNKTKTINP